MTLIMKVEQNLLEPIIYDLNTQLNVPVHRVGNFYAEKTGPGCGKTCLWNGGGYYQDEFTCGTVYPSGKTFYCSSDCFRKIGETEKVFISYRWKDSKLVDMISACALGVDIEILRDVREMGFLDEISKFMSAAGASRYFVAIMSEEYFYSRHCWYEFSQLVESAIEIRILPLVLGNAGSVVNENKYLRFWTNKHAELTGSLSQIENQYKSYLDKELRLLEQIPSYIANFLAEWRAKKVAGGEWWLSNNCRYLIGAIKTTFRPSSEDASNWTYSNKRVRGARSDDASVGLTWVPEPFFLHAFSETESKVVSQIPQARKLIRGTFHQEPKLEQIEPGVHLVLLNDKFLLSLQLCLRLIELHARDDVTVVPVFLDDSLRAPASEIKILQRWNMMLKKARKTGEQHLEIELIMKQICPLIEILRDTLVPDINLVFTK